DPDDPTSLSSDLVDSIYEDRDGVLWVGTWSGPTGLNRFNRETDTFTRYLHDPQDATSLHSRFVSAFYEDSRGMLWMGGDGLVKFDRAAGQFTQYLQDELIYTIHEDQEGRLWVGGDTGFYLFDRETGAAESFTGTHGLPNIGALGIVGDEAGNLWLSRQGLIRFNPETFSVRPYGRADGLPSLDFNRTAYFKSQSGEIFFGSRGGAVAFYPERVMDNPYVPPIVLTDFKLFNKSVPVGEDGPLNAHISVVESIALTYDQNDVTFEFAALNYRHAEKNRYAYMLEGYDDAWREVGTQRTATYANLSPGDYVFRVKGSNDDGVWNEEGATIRLTITPPFWQRWWFYTLCAWALLAVVVGSYRLRVRHLKQRQRELAREVEARTRELALEKQKTEAQAEKLQEMDRLKSRFFANISHEFRTPLTLILGPLRDALNGVGRSLDNQQLRMMQRSGLRLHRLIDQLLDLSKLEAGRMYLHARQRNLTEYLRGLVQSFASLAESRHIRLQYHAEEEELLLYFDADKLEKVISNLLSNAFKFTSAQGQIQVNVRDVSGEIGTFTSSVAGACPGLR
ncbi:MAG: triple tyrosine motif-containing protein, partial [Rhodothermales bacterium]